MAQNNRYRVPIGVYFKPSDSEIVDYLNGKNCGLPLPPDLIEEFDIYTCSPDELIGKFKYGKENELYFFVPRNLEKSRMERIVKQNYGFWRSTGNTKEIYRDEVVTVQKGTLDFYIKSGNDKKTKWKMNEYSRLSMDQTSSGRGAKRMKVSRFTLCKIYAHKPEEVENPMGGMPVGDGDGSNVPDSGPPSWNFEDLQAWLATTLA